MKAQAHLVKLVDTIDSKSIPCSGYRFKSDSEQKIEIKNRESTVFSFLIVSQNVPFLLERKPGRV